MNHVIICTVAYNAEKTIRRTIDSVLKQSYDDFTYYIIDNASTDMTGEIIRSCAQCDNRFIVHTNKLNQEWEPGTYWLDFAKQYGDDCYFCLLDADDEYKPDFFNKTLTFIHENNLDIAACGSDFLDENTKQILSLRSIDNNLIVENMLFSECFSQYYQFMRTSWGKLYSVRILRKCYFESELNGYASDTEFTIKTFRQADRVGIMAGTQHKYYISNKSTSYKFEPNRIKSDQRLYKKAQNLLIIKCGIISHENSTFLYMIYFHAIADTLKVLVNSQITISEKIHNICDIFSTEITKELYSFNFNVETKGTVNSLKRGVLDWILNQKVIYTDNDIDAINNAFFAEKSCFEKLDLLNSMKFLISRIPGVLLFLWDGDFAKAHEQLQKFCKRNDWDSQAFAKLEMGLYELTNKRLEEKFDLLIRFSNKKRISAEYDIAEQLENIFKSKPLLSHVNDWNFVIRYCDVARQILCKNWVNALDLVVGIALDEQPPKNAEELYVLGQNLAALAEHAPAFIFFKKAQISLYINESKFIEAKKIIEELESILDNDEDIAEFKRAIEY